MTITELKQILEAYGKPCAFSHFAEDQKPPYICWIYTDSSNEFADEMVYKAIKSIQIEYYVRQDVPTEVLAFENYLTSHKVRWEQTGQEWLDEEKIYLFTYQTEVLNG